MCNVAVIILAAGASTRLGQPKQLLQFDGRSLLRHAVETALQSLCRPVIVVINERLEHDLQGYPVMIVANPDAGEGIASSIRIGVKAVPDFSAGAVIMLVDQPLVTPELIKELASSKSMAGARYNNALGVPAFFPRRYFPELLALEGDCGAKGILKKHKAEAIEFPDGAVDIDTPEQARSVLRSR